MNSDVRLREVIESDLPIFFGQQRDPEAVQVAAIPPREHDVFVAHWEKILHDEAIIINTILFDGQVAGNILSFPYKGKREVGYWLGREFWGKGIASRALSAFLEQLEERPLYASVARPNIASLRVLQKCGFTIIGEEKGPFGREDNVIEQYILELKTRVF